MVGEQAVIRRELPAFYDKKIFNEKDVYMKRVFISSLILLIFIFSFAACRQKETYSPVFTLAEGYTLDGDRISATLIGQTTLKVRDFLISSDAITVYADSTGVNFVQGLEADIPLKQGENHMILTFSNGTMSKDYYLDITCVSIESFSIIVNNPAKTYHIGEAFDKSTITVIAVKEDGTEFEVKHYIPEYEFSSLGESIVGIELDGLYESITVEVTEEYRPVLSETGMADGVQYLIQNQEAILLRVEEKEGFFAVPSVVVMNGEEYPVTKINDHAFVGSWITGILIPDSVRTIGNEVFSGCRTLEWVEMPETLESLGSFAFYNCESLVSVSLPSGLKELKDSVFRNCKALSFVSLPSSLEVIEKQAFAGCQVLSDLQFPQNLRVIEEDAFLSCKQFSTIIVENLQVLGNRAFADCSELQFVAVGKIDSLGNDVFSGVKSASVYSEENSAILKQAASCGLKNFAVTENEYYVASVPTEFPIEEAYPYEETNIFFLSRGKLRRIFDYTVEYPKDACGYLDATIRKDSFSHTFKIFISYTEELALDTDSRGVQYSLDSVTGKATLVRAPELVRPGNVYQPETEGLFIVPTTLWREGKMYVVVDVEEDAFEDTKNVKNIFTPALTKES